MSAPRFPAFRVGENEIERVRKLIGLLQGKLNAASQDSFTLAANVASTTITDPLIGPNSKILLMPTTANAAGALATTYVSARTNGSATVTHANNAQADRTFAYAVIG